MENNDSVSVLKKKNRTGLIVVLVVLAVVLLIGGAGGWYYTLGPCGTIRVQKASAELTRIAGDWEDAARLADSTPRMALSSQIANMQSIQDELQAVDVPACLEQARAQLDDGMSGGIRGYTLFLAQAEEAQVTSQMRSSAGDYVDGLSQLEEVSQCAPFCRPDPYEMQVP